MSTFIELLVDAMRTARSEKARPFLLVTLCVDGAFIFVFLVAIQSYLHSGSLALPGYALAAYGLAKLLAQLFAGRLIDRVGSGKAAQAGLVVIAIGQASLLAAISVPGVVLLGAAVYGFGSALLWPALFARASDWFPAEERAKLTSSMTLTTGVALIAGLGLGLALPARFPYAAATAIALAAIVLAAISARRLTTGTYHESAAGEQTAEHVTVRQLISTALEGRRVGFALVVLFESSAIGALQAVFRSYGRDFLEVSFRYELLLLAPAAALGACAVFVGGALADKLGRLPLLGVGFLAAGAAIWLLSTTTSTVVLVPLAVLGGVGAGLAMPSVSALSMDLSRTGGQGTVLAWFMTMEGLGHAGGAGLGGWLNTGGGVPDVIRFVAALFLVTGGGAIVALCGGLLQQLSAARADQATSDGGLAA